MNAYRQLKGVFTYATSSLELKYHHWPSLYVRPWNPININPPQPLPTTRLVLRYSGITTSEAWRNSYSFSPSGKLNQALSCKHPVLCCNACFILTAARKDCYHLPTLNALDTSSIHIYIYIITINIIIINYYYYHYSYHYYHYHYCHYCHYYYYFYYTSYTYITCLQPGKPTCFHSQAGIPQYLRDPLFYIDHPARLTGALCIPNSDRWSYYLSWAPMFFALPGICCGTVEQKTNHYLCWFSIQLGVSSPPGVCSHVMISVSVSS